jgi:hypothetical protein
MKRPAPPSRFTLLPLLLALALLTPRCARSAPVEDESSTQPPPENETQQPKVADDDDILLPPLKVFPPPPAISFLRSYGDDDSGGVDFKLGYSYEDPRTSDGPARLFYETEHGTHPPTHETLAHILLTLFSRNCHALSPFCSWRVVSRAYIHEGTNTRAFYSPDNAAHPAPRSLRFTQTR